jgi:hypothetical protein
MQKVHPRDRLLDVAGSNLRGSRVPNDGAIDEIMTKLPLFDYNASAELFPSDRKKPRRPTGYRRFSTAAEAIRYAIEELPAEYLVGAILEVNEDRFEADEIRRLYDDPTYPLPRR